MKKICISILIIFLLCVLSACSSTSNNNSTTTKQEHSTVEPKPKHSPAEASVMAEQFAQKKLKSPGSAKFQSFLDQKIEDLGEGKYKISSYVDSQNSFGALVRNNYTCTLKYIDNNKWQLENLEFKQ